ncbi:efflux transporter outer membrane subunit [Mucilaginibacter sp. RS28]|uniref:Efflux transporter outer membrane subunit n=1 Tax=Mucilaginibacter straminoryzae TaxID=2932774 RepID=A0A9X1X1R3_9SPHI|nr:efflux transporter outer membrane subunit [Mucilaginibacter straminoryzae]MCJ8209559.1 efflux transporter outer membrane subunit [Mucilaginibacter straminoryzae]
MKTNNFLTYTILFTSLVIASCKVGKNYQRPDAPLPAQFNNVSYADTSSIGDLEWRQFFTDATLQSLIDKGIQYNYDLQIALKRIDAANERVKQAKLILLPDLNLQVAGQYNRPSKNSLNGLSANGFLGSSHIEDYNANLNLSWEIDTWGKLRRQKEAALAQYLQTYEAKKAVQTRLVSDIAQGYYNLLMLEKQLSISKRNLELSDSTLRLTRLLKTAGEVTLLAVQQADAQRQTTALLIPQLEQNIAIQQNALQILTGQLPGEIAHTSTLDALQLPSQLSTGLPAGLLARRPDVRSTEMALVAANAQVGVAQGNMYPSLVISANGGLESLKASTWFNVPASLFGIVNGSILQPLINRRRYKTEFEVAKVNRETAVLQFRQSVLNATGEVSNALIQNQKLDQQRLLAVNQVDTLKQAVKNAQLLFKSDMANYLEVITAQTNALQAELNLAAIKRNEMGSVIELYRSLGGGWK